MVNRTTALARALSVALVAGLSSLSWAQTSSQKAAVQLSATVQSSPASITLAWTTLPSTTSITVYRKLADATSWGSAIASPSASATTYQDAGVAAGTAYEYKVVRVAAGVTGTGYISSGIAVPPVDYRGRMILLVDNTYSSSLSSELATLQADLRMDGWSVVRTDLARTASVASVKSTIQGLYNADATNTKAVFIVGHLAVPYSGNINPDGHSEHQGAWPCDGYYGELNGSWTDNSVNNAGASRTENRNTPGDGKFDQSTFPNAVELQVGRVDFYNMPAFSQNETELTRSYLNKLHGFKMKQWTPTARGLVYDNLQWVSNPLAASAWRSIAPLVGASNITAANQNATQFKDLVNNQSYLWTYASGGGLMATDAGVLTYNGADRVGTTQDFAGTVTNGGVFNMTFGSYFGDWDNRNNFLRALLASGYGLTNCWSAIPGYYFHHMGMGANIGYSVQATMNNTALYTPLTDGWQSTIGRSHVSLMGDPSLRMKMLVPPSSLAVTNIGGYASFTWQPSTETVDGYHLYSIDASTGVVTRITGSLVTGTSYTSPTVPFVSGREYMVRAVRLITEPSGSYYNLSLGVSATASGSSGGSGTPDCNGVVGGSAMPGTACNDGNACTINDTWNSNCQCVGTPSTPSATITAGGSTSFCSGGSVTLSVGSCSGCTYQWKLNGSSISGATGTSYSASAAGSYTVTVTNSGGCASTSSATTVSLSSAPAATISASGSTSFCSGSSVALSVGACSGCSYQWKLNASNISGATTAYYNTNSAGSYTVTVTNSGGCATTSAATVITVGTPPTATISASGSTTLCSTSSVTLSATACTGCTYQWLRDGTAISGATSSSYSASSTGSYAATVTSSGCSATSAAIAVTSSAPAASITASGSTSFCSGGSVALSVGSCTGCTYQWKRNGANVSGATATSFTASTAGSYTVTVTSGSCSATSAATTVAVGTAPAASITNGSTASFCSGSTVSLAASTCSGCTYQWLRNGSAITGATSSTYTASSTGSYTIIVTSSGCSSTSSATTVSSMSAPVISCSSSSSASTVSVSVSSGTGPYTYSWNTNPVQSTATANVSPGTYTVTVRGSNGCQTTCTTTLVPSATGCSAPHTVTQGVWGATASGTNPAAYMTQNWSQAFPASTYLTIGCGSRIVRYTTAQAVINALPSYGTAALLPAGTSINPTGISNTLLGHLAALKISVRMDEIDPSFSSSGTLLKNMVIASGTFGGWTVQQLIDHADQAIGGCVSQYPLVVVASAVANINNGYDGPNENSGYLVCPNTLGIAPQQTPDADMGLEELQPVSVFPNPTAGPLTILIPAVEVDAVFSVDLYSLTGAYQSTIRAGRMGAGVEHRIDWDASSVARGAYLLRVAVGERVQHVRLMAD